MDELDRLATSMSSATKSVDEEMAAIVAGVSNKLNIGKQPKYPASKVDSILDDSDEDNNVFEDEDEEVMPPASHPLAMFKNPPKMDDESNAAAEKKSPKACGRTSEKTPSASTTADNDYGTGDDDSNGSGSDEDAAQKSGNGSDSAEDYTDDEDEGEDGYKPGGYHPVKVGEVYNQR
jgi:hypothetical protein